MKTTKLQSVEGFLLVDLPDAERSVGPARLGSKLIVSNATNYAREITYGFGLLEQKFGGMTIGIKVAPGDRTEAVSLLAEELGDDLRAGRLVPDPGLRMARDDLADLATADPRQTLRLSDRPSGILETELMALGAAIVADRAVGLDGKTVAIEGLDQRGVAIAREVEARGGSVARISTSKGVVSGSFSADDLSAAEAEHGVEAPGSFGEVDKPWTIWRGTDVAAIFCGSGVGVLKAAGSPGIGTTAVIASGVAPIETKALAILNAAGAFVSPAFLAGLGSLLVGYDASIENADDARARTEDVIGAVLDDVVGHSSGAYVAACLRSESFIESWADERPFGRPMA